MLGLKKMNQMILRKPERVDIKKNDRTIINKNNRRLKKLLSEAIENARFNRVFDCKNAQR